MKEVKKLILFLLTGQRTLEKFSICVLGFKKAFIISMFIDYGDALVPEFMSEVKNSTVPSVVRQFPVDVVYHYSRSGFTGAGE